MYKRLKLSSQKEIRLVIYDLYSMIVKEFKYSETYIADSVKYLKNYTVQKTTNALYEVLRKECMQGNIILIFFQYA